jgi:ferredoxin-NADP reductase
MSVTTSAPTRAARRLLDVAALLTTPLLPEDYLGLVDPLWSSRELRARVEQVRPEAAGAATLVLRPGRGWSPHTAGQWVRLGVRIDGVLHWRSYSLTCPVQPDGTISVTVQATADGFVSRHLVQSARPGTVLRLDHPAGEFVLPPVGATEPLLFVTAGSGITPVMGMLRTLVQQGDLPDAVLVHSARTYDDVIFGEELRALAAQHPRFTLVERHSDVDGRLTTDELSALVPDWRERETWACGPPGLLDAVEDHWQASGVRGRLHLERFRPKVLAGPTGDGGEVAFTRAGATVDADGSTALLDAGEDAGVLMPSGCRMGICFSCVVPLLSGQVRDLRTGEVHGEPGSLIQTCVSAAAGPVEIDL